MPGEECAATPLPLISLGTSVIVVAHLAQISTSATGRTEQKFGRLVACTDASETRGGGGMKNWNEKRACLCPTHFTACNHRSILWGNSSCGSSHWADCLFEEDGRGKNG